MAAPMAPMKDTLRIVEWDELPPSVREIPDAFDPLADGVLMRHQAQWCAIRTPIKAAKKGRRTGITFAEALDDVLVAASRKEVGGMDVFYIPDTKDKGLEFIGYAAKFSRVIAQRQGAVSSIEEFLFKDQDDDGNSKDILAYRIRYASGFRIVALSSAPANIRGLQGKVVIDEAAFHRNVDAVIEAATALLIWGGMIAIISSLNGKRNGFWKFCCDIEAGTYGEHAVVFTATFDDAVKNGLYERVCMMKRTTPTAEGKKAWYAMVRGGYGPRKAAMREELDAIPRDGNGVAIPWVWIDRSMRQVRPVLRLACEDDFNRRPDADREAWVADWIKRELDPLLAKLDRSSQHVLGMDFARHRHFSSITPTQLTSTLTRYVPFILELHNVPARQQKQILWHTIRRLPRFSSAALDATGPGMILAEDTADEFGATRIHQVTLSRSWYGLWMPRFIQLFEDSTIDLPRDANIESDLGAVETIDGIPMVGPLERKDLKDPDLVRHGDAAIALCLANFAALNRSAPIEFESAAAPSANAAELRDFLMTAEGDALDDYLM